MPCIPRVIPPSSRTFADDNAILATILGLVKLTILPPRGLYHPVLPLRQGGKLTFPLCRTCVEVQMALPMEDRTWRCRPFCRTASSHGYVVYPGGAGGRPSRLFRRATTRSLALSSKPAKVWTIQGLRQHVAEEQDGGQRLPSLDRHGREEESVRRRLRPEGGDSPGA